MIYFVWIQFQKDFFVRLKDEYKILDLLQIEENSGTSYIDENSMQKMLGRFSVKVFRVLSIWKEIPDTCLLLDIDSYLVFLDTKIKKRQNCIKLNSSK